ncbi:hypothetical protein OJAV_G00155500 [Oryzias javanicus]|uniref:Uncharacterized protein n=1 Tax=Oryzias javanicus TaxID=123683 RepID=A0A437CHX4_ORYJA|nr:hypothetical protein OJAV_G00155500 [Oryzias javanicus]
MTASVSSHADKSILGGQAREELQLVKRVGTIATTKSPQLTKPSATKEELIEEYAEVFTGLGVGVTGGSTGHLAPDATLCI